MNFLVASKNAVIGFFRKQFAAGFLLLSWASLASTPALAEQSAAPPVAESKPSLSTVLAEFSEKAIGGTGRTAKAIGGTGRNSKAIGGTGRSAKAIGGTGRSAKAIGGTGRATKAIGGTGRSTKAIGGTGRASKAIGGTGRTAKAIGGTGRSTKAIGGTGRMTKAIGGTGRSLKAFVDADDTLDAALLRGAVEAWDGNRRVLTVLSQQFAVGGDEQFAVGQTAVIEGDLDSEGKIVAEYAWVDSSDFYVQGSSEVVVTGRITAVSAANGKFTIGALVVDYTQLLWNSSFTPAIGSFVTIVGTQAVLNGELQARTGVVRR